MEYAIVGISKPKMHDESIFKRKKVRKKREKMNTEMREQNENVIFVEVMTILFLLHYTNSFFSFALIYSSALHDWAGRGQQAMEALGTPVLETKGLVTLKIKTF